MSVIELNSTTGCTTPCRDRTCNPGLARPSSSSSFEGIIIINGLLRFIKQGGDRGSSSSGKEDDNNKQQQEGEEEEELHCGEGDTIIKYKGQTVAVPEKRIKWNGWCGFGKHKINIIRVGETQPHGVSLSSVQWGT